MTGCPSVGASYDPRANPSSSTCVARRTQPSDRVQIEARLRCGILRRPLETFNTKLTGSGQSVTIQLPEMRVIDVRGTGTVPLGGWILVGTDKPIDGGRLVLALLRVTGSN